MDHIDRICAQWHRERPDLDTGPMALLGRLKRLSDRLAAELNQVYEAHGLTAASFDVLATLRRAGPPFRLSPSALVTWTMVTSGTMTNRLDRLEGAGLIHREPNPEDSRSRLVSLSRIGRELVDKVISVHVANQHRLVAGLDSASRDALDGILREWLTTLLPDEEQGGVGPT